VWSVPAEHATKEHRMTITRYTVTEKHQADDSVLWTVREGRKVALKVEAPQERGMWDTGLLRKALAEHAGASEDQVSPVRGRKDTQVAAHVWEVRVPEAAPAPLVADGEYRMHVGILRDEAKDMGTVQAANVRAAIANADGWPVERLDDGTIKVGYSYFEPQRVEEPEPRPAAEVLGADPVPADTSVLEGMPGQPVGREGVPTRDAVTHEAYVMQLRSEGVWMLPNHDDRAHMTQAKVIGALAWARQAAPNHTRVAVDTDGTVYVSTGRQAARYIPASLIADYSADQCPGCHTAYATNGDGPCTGGRSPLAPGSRDYEAEAAELLGEGEEWVRHWYNGGKLSGVNSMGRREALQTVVLGLKRGEVHPAGDGERGLRVAFDGGESAYWLEPVAEEAVSAPQTDEESSR
jgi:hypothetical protein